MSIFDIGIAIVSLIAHVTIALITPTVWALVLGSVITGAVTLISSFLFIPGLRHRFVIDPECARQLLRFGKWVFLSSIVYFFAMNFDRLYFAKQISLSQLGVYGIARSLADMVTLFVARASSFVLYPSVAAAGLAPVDLRKRLLRGRRTLLLGAAVGMGGFLAVSEIIVRLLYDARYSEAAWILPVLCVGVWFGILTSTNDSILMGLARPAYPALSNAAKLITYVVGVPLAFVFYGFTARVAVIAFGEIVKYVRLWLLSHKEHLRVRARRSSPDPRVRARPRSSSGNHPDPRRRRRYSRRSCRISCPEPRGCDPVGFVVIGRNEERVSNAASGRCSRYPSGSSTSIPPPPMEA